MMSSGEEKAWELLRGLDPMKVEKNASVRYVGERGCYLLSSLGIDMSVCPGKESISAPVPGAEALIARLSYFFNHAALWYLVNARDIGLAGRLVKPENLKGGHHFFTGTHELPLKGLAGKYSSDRDEFLKRAEELGGRPLEYGDASVELYPFPRIPVTLILWLEDEEFPSRADLLFDSSAELHAPIDIIWSVAMFSIISML
jgi:hypothetical protein